MLFIIICDIILNVSTSRGRLGAYAYRETAMVKFLVTVRPPQEFEDESWRTKTFEWPVVPQKGQSIQFSLSGGKHVTLRVYDVAHMFSDNEIFVHCGLCFKDMETFRSLSKKEGWTDGT